MHLTYKWGKIGSSKKICGCSAPLKTPIGLALNMSFLTHRLKHSSCFFLYVIKIELGLIYLPHQSVRHWPSIRFSNDSKFHPFCESAILHTLTLVSNSTYSLFGSMIFLFCPRLGERVSVRRVRVRDRRLFWFIVQKRLIPRSALFEEKKTSVWHSFFKAFLLIVKLVMSDEKASESVT